MPFGKLLNADYWNKAYLLEFKLNGVLTDAFTFSVPPESEDFVLPQRKNETKTFGGAVIAEYGNDLVQINLSGSTINQELKLIYKSSFGSTEMTGEQEIFYLRDLFKKYGSRENLQGKEVYLYSLNGGRNARHNPKWWRIFVGQLDISRSKDKPFCYNYKLSATGAPEVTPKKYVGNIYGNGYKQTFKKFGQTLEGWYAKVTAITNEMDKVANTIEEYGGGFINEISGYIGTARECVNKFRSACGRYADVINGIITGAGDVVIDTVMLGDKVINQGFRYYATISADVWNTCLDTVGAFKSIYNTFASFDSETFNQSYWQSIKELFDDSVSNEDILDVYCSLAHDGIKAANESRAITSKNLNNMGVAVIPGDTGEDDSIVITYGYKVISVTDAETSWDQIAKDYYGDASLASVIATFNNLPTDTPLQAGYKILIPSLNYAETRAVNNEVYNSPDVKDNYGKDIIIIDKDFGIYNGDLNLANGIDNLEQALLNRYSTLVGARIRLEVYGIQASIGDALDATSALIQASVHQTTVEDPRVESVEDISFIGMGDELTVTVIYIDRNGAKRNFGGTV